MSKTTLFLLSEDERLVQVVAEAVAGAEVLTVSCLTEVDTVHRDVRLVIDPRLVRSCCLERLARWSHRLTPRQVVFVCLPAPPEVLLGLPLACPGTVARMDQLAGILRETVLASQARSAWANRSQILAADERGKEARRLLDLVTAHDHEAYTVSEAAAALRMNVRQLRRRSVRSFGYPPATILGLARVASVCREISKTGQRLGAIAKAHGFRSVAALSRQFLRFHGARPAAYRARVSHRDLSETDL